MRANTEMGFNIVDFNGPSQVGTGFLQAFIDSRSVRMSSSNAYIDPNPFPNNLHITTRSLVIRILFSDNTAVGVEFIRNDKTYTVRARKEVIISAGNQDKQTTIFIMLIFHYAYLFQVP